VSILATMPPKLRQLHPLVRRQASRPLHVVSVCVLDSVGYLAALRAEEDNPYGKTLAEVLEVMLGSGTDKHEIAWPEWLSLRPMTEDTAAANDDVDLVLAVGRLFVRADWKGELYIEGPALQKACRMLARGPRDSRSSVRESNHTATDLCGQGPPPSSP
jgi:hypothetical protein